MVYAAFVLLATAIVFLSMKLSKYVDLLDKTTNVSGAFIGGVLLAAVTSLPELFTSLSAVLLLRENSLVTGNILGSNLFNLAVLGSCVALMFRGFSRASVGKHYVLHLLLCFGSYALIALPVFVRNLPKMGYASLVSPFIFVLYILSIVFTPKSEQSEADTPVDLSLRQIVSRFVLSAVLLVGMSIALTYVSDAIADKLDLGKTFAGALLLGITTSLPELVSSLSLCRRGNFNAAAGNVVGSNMFNFAILFLSDVLGFRKGSTSVYAFFRDGAVGMQTMLLLLLGAASTLLAVILLLTKTRAPQKKMLGHVTALSCGPLLVASYLLFVILSTTLV